MPSTAQNVTLIEAATKGRFSRPQILSILSEIQDVVYSQRTEETKKISATTGYPPYIVTTDGTYRYDCPSDCWMTEAIFAETPIRRFSANTIDHGQNLTYYWQNREYQRIEVSQTLKTVGVLATVTFKENPGATTEKYYHSYWIKADPLEDETDELVLPENTHYILRMACEAMLDGENYGSIQERLGAMDVVAKRIRKELNRGARGRIGKTMIQSEYRDWNFGGYGYFQ